MSRRTKSSANWRLLSPSLLILVGIAGILSVLAILQYRWITEVSEAEQRRLKESLGIALTRFAEDFESEMRLLSPFRRPGPAPPRDYSAGDTLLDRLAERNDRWMSASRHPGLLRDLFAAEVISPGDVQLLRFDPEDRSLRPVEWPAEFADFRRNVIAESLGERPVGRGGRGMERRDLQHIPALAIPFMQVQRRPDPENPEFNFFRLPPPIPKGWEIIRLDSKYLSEVFLPFLVERHFSKQGSSDYEILIADAETGKVVYRSSPGLILSDFADASDGDIHLAIGGFGGGDQRRGPGPPNGQFGRGGPPPREPGGWELYAKHNAGSLQSFTDQLRRRNLVISFGILAILATAIAFTILSSERIRAMGRLQLEFATGLSHELRTPLTAIRSAGHNLASGKITGPDDVARYGSLLQEQGLRLSNMVEQALLFAQTQSGRNRYQRVPVDVVEIIDREIRSCSALLPQYPCEIATQIDPALPLAITDPQALSHCIHNLLVNALKYGPANGSITVTAMRDMTKPEPEVTVTVHDTGPGIPDSELPHIFEPFLRGHNTTGVPGSGLGLYIVKSIMESLGGRVSISSSASAGTSFTLHIPSAASGQEA